MSNIYIQEPPTNGKVLLVTSVGEIDIELWSKECPKACRNFVQLCMEGYYDGTIFHRVVKNFIVQGGDPTGSGDGGESIYGQTFKDEFHSRLRFTRRGLVAMANAGAHDNGSQFFFTLAEAPELQNKHTLFGKITGTTVFNMLKLVEVETDSNERPMFPHKIIRVEILSNPYDDIIPRVIKKNDEAKTDKKKKSKSKATKNFKLLSFGEEAEEDEVEVNEATNDLKHKSKSIHDLDVDPMLSAEPAVNEDEISKRKTDSDQEDSNESNDDDNSETVMSIRKKLKKDAPSENMAEEPVEKKEKNLSRSEQLRNEARQLKKELQGKKTVKQEDTPTEEEKDHDNEVVKEYKKELQKYKEIRKKMPKKGGSREEQTLAMLAKFQNKVQEVRQETADKEEAPVPEDNEDEGADPGIEWLGHKLDFEDKSQKVIDANVADLDRYEIFDPRNPMTQRRREESKQKMKDKKSSHR